MDRVPQCRLLTPFQEGTHYIVKKSKFCKKGGKLDYSRYSQVCLLTLYYHWQTLTLRTQFQFDSSLLFRLDVLTT